METVEPPKFVGMVLSNGEVANFCRETDYNALFAAYQEQLREVSRLQGLNREHFIAKNKAERRAEQEQDKAKQAAEDLEAVRSIHDNLLVRANRLARERELMLGVLNALEESIDKAMSTVRSQT